MFYYSNAEPARPVMYEQFRGGAEELSLRAAQLQLIYPEAHWICENFTARSPKGFSYTTASLEPLVGIGVLIDRGVIDRDDKNQMCDPRLQYFAGGKDKAEKKKRQHAWLKEHDLYVTPKSVSSPDADDVRSSMAHAIAWFRRQKHMPTINHYFPESKDD